MLYLDIKKFASNCRPPLCVTFALSDKSRCIMLSLWGHRVCNATLQKPCLEVISALSVVCLIKMFHKKSSWRGRRRTQLPTCRRYLVRKLPLSSETETTLFRRGVCNWSSPLLNWGSHLVSYRPSRSLMHCIHLFIISRPDLFWNVGYHCVGVGTV